MKSSLPIPFPLSTDLQANIELLLNKLGTNSDVIIRRMDIGIIKPLLTSQETEFYWNQEICFHDLLRQALTISNLTATIEGVDLLAALLDVNTAILANGYNEALIAGTTGWDKRAIEEPQTQTVVRGPKESLTDV